MKSSFQVLTGGGKSFTYELVKPEILVGRELKNDLVLDDPRVSRTHAAIIRRDRSVILRDLESGNGTFINGIRIEPLKDFKLTSGDEIKLGSSTLTFSESDPYGTRLNSESFREVLHKKPDDVLTNSMLSDYPESQEVPSIVYRHEIEKKDRVLKLFYELSQKLGSLFSLDEIYEKVSEILLSVTPASRCFIFRKNDQGEFEQVAAKTRGTGEIGEPLPISQTIFRKVASERVSVLLDDSHNDLEFSSNSVLSIQVQSVMAAPIIGPRGLLGIIYADRHDILDTFSADDLDLLNTVAVHTSIAINTVINHDRLQKQAQARASFERFLPRQVVDQILRSPDEIRLGGVRQMITALFADIRSFTTLSETRTPEMVVSMLNRYFSMLSEIIFLHGGTLDKYIGDGMMALFGAPYVGELDAIQAVRAAIEMQRAMVVFNRQLEAENLPPISIGIGINTGPAIVGYIGSETRLDYTAIGDTVNTAARLESLAKPGQIVISENTMQVLDESFRLNPLGTEKLKGKNVNLKIAEVEWR